MDNYKSFSKNAKKILNTPICNNKMQTAHYTAMENLFCPETNKDGYISLGIAENVLSFDVLKDKLSVDPNFCQRLTQYSDMGGFRDCRESIANLLQNHLFKYKPLSNPELLVNYKQIILANGATPLLENIFNMFCDQDEVALIPSPMFPNFIPFAGQRFGVKIIGVKSEVYSNNNNNNNNNNNENDNNNNNNGKIIDFELNLEEFEKQYQLHPVKLVVLCNPNNPTGYIFSKKQIKQLVDWCREKKVHLLSDEIYALSIFNRNYCSGTREDNENNNGNNNNNDNDNDNEVEKDGANNQIPTNTFSSIYDICKGDMGEYVHLVSSFSKDFGLNGFRAGYFYSQNKDVLRYLISTSNYYSCSNIVQSALINIIEDKKYLCSFIKENQKRLASSYNFAIKTLEHFNIPYLKSSAGLFLTIDLRKCLNKLPELKENNNNDCPFKKEIQLWELLFDNRVIVNPGKLCYFSEPGFYRLIFTLPNEFVYNGIERISKVYNQLLNSK
ncbi:hypothetical protein ACTFIU_007167 [Dictyostelium citrinum]